ncbi:hypothetical protein Tco_0577624 [Tanacetum coccineum]
MTGNRALLTNFVEKFLGMVRFGNDDFAVIDGYGDVIPSWMITDEMKLMEHYQMYVEAFGVDVPMTQSQPIQSTQGTHRTNSAPRSPNPDVDEGESSVQQKSTVIRLRIPLR